MELNNNNSHDNTPFPDHSFFDNNIFNEGSTVATGWFFFSIALGSLFTFTFFAALSTSFYCCEKTRRKKSGETNQVSLNERNTGQKLFFPNVPSTIYPTTHSVLQQEQNEVVESLSPAYRELPSTHLTYPSSYDTINTVDQTFWESNKSAAHSNLTTYPDSTQTSSKSRTASSSSEQLPNTNRSAVISIPDCFNDHHLQSQSASELENDTSLSIRIESSQNPEVCMTSSTSGILSDENLLTRTSEEKTNFSRNASRLPEPSSPGIFSGKHAVKDSQNDSSMQLMSELQTQQHTWLDEHCTDCCSPKQLACLRSAERLCRSSRWKLIKEKLDAQTRSFSERESTELSECGKRGVGKQFTAGTRNDKREGITCVDYRRTGNDEKRAYVTDKVKNNPMINDSSRGASILGDDRLFLSNPSWTAPSNYYELTFCREASILSDESNNSCVRAASAFAFQRGGGGLEKLQSSHSAGQSVSEEFHEDRGASSFGMITTVLPRSQQETARLGRNEEIIPLEESIHQDPHTTLNLICHSTHQNSTSCYRPPKLISDDGYKSRDHEEPMRRAQTVLDNLNTIDQSDDSVRGASELGDQDGVLGKCDGNDSLFESISLSFAYESTSEDEVPSLSCREQTGRVLYYER